ncbi:MAG: hypothetical protein HC919_10860 [Oscillatoriales cyanobacterium SM2_2_1]|nr:hypothetical protein [Oscillatoriales cyanobacterium SM2_2_1]
MSIWLLLLLSLVAIGIPVGTWVALLLLWKTDRLLWRPLVWILVSILGSVVGPWLSIAVIYLLVFTVAYLSGNPYVWFLLIYVSYSLGVLLAITAVFTSLLQAPLVKWFSRGRISGREWFLTTLIAAAYGVVLSTIVFYFLRGNYFNSNANVLVSSLIVMLPVVIVQAMAIGSWCWLGRMLVMFPLGIIPLLTSITHSIATPISFHF